MKTIYFTRHGQTVWNVENKICGITDSPLTDKGRMQAQALAKQLEADSHGITRILCSPLSGPGKPPRLWPPAPGCP